MEVPFEIVDDVAAIVGGYSDSEFEDIICAVRKLRLKTEQAKEICNKYGLKFMWMNSMDGFAYEKDGYIYGVLFIEIDEDMEWIGV